MNQNDQITIEETEETADEPQCCCLEVMGDNHTCPLHGDMFHD
jgi:hypothetical protein